MNVTRNDNLSAHLGVDLIRLAHCTFVYPSGDSTKLVVRIPFDNKTTAVVLIRYVDRTSFSMRGDDRGLFMLVENATASVPAALNSSTMLYTFAPSTSRFQPHANSVSPTNTSINGSYTVTGKLYLYPEVTPEQTGVFLVEESHTLVSQFVAEIDLEPNYGCD